MSEKKTPNSETTLKTAVKAYSFRIKREAFNLYLDDIPPREISARLDIPETTLKGWIQAKDWKSKKDALQADAMKNTVDQYKSLIEKHQFLTLKRKLRTAALIDKAIQNLLIGPDGNMLKLTPERIRDIATAFKSNADVDGKMLGLSQNGQQTLVLAGRGAMVNIGVQGAPISTSLPAPASNRSLPPVEAEVSRPAYEQPIVPGDADPF